MIDISYRVLRSKNLLDASFLRDAIELYTKVYPEQWQVTYDDAYARYQVNNDIYYLLYDDDKLIGYLCVIPIKQSLYEKMMSAKHTYDSEIQATDIEVYAPYKHYVLYIMSIVISPEYQYQGLSMMLIIEFYYDLAKKHKEGIFVDKLLAVAVTEGGEKILRNLGFDKGETYEDGGIMYTQELSDEFYAHF